MPLRRNTIILPQHEKTYVWSKHRRQTHTKNTYMFPPAFLVGAPRPRVLDTVCFSAAICPRRPLFDIGPEAAGHRSAGSACNVNALRATKREWLPRPPTLRAIIMFGLVSRTLSVAIVESESDVGGSRNLVFALKLLLQTTFHRFVF